MTNDDAEFSLCATAPDLAATALVSLAILLSVVVLPRESNWRVWGEISKKKAENQSKVK